jgi:hypothetical protein
MVRHVYDTVLGGNHVTGCLETDKFIMVSYTWKQTNSPWYLMLGNRQIHLGVLHLETDNFTMVSDAWKQTNSP